jgi:tripartite-type tricarboxylate transporter receptor subunit TctC
VRLASLLHTVALALAALPAAAPAQGWPEKPIRLVVFVPPGGIHDTMVRIIQPRLSEALGQPIVIENRPGAGGNIAAEAVAKSPADGYTFLVASEAMATNRFLYRSIGFDASKELVPVTKIADFPLVLALHPSVAANTVAEFVALARSQPGKISYGSAGVGTSGHLSGELFASMTGIDIVHVPYKGGAPAMSDLVAGRIQAMFISVTLTAPLLREGKLKVLAVAARERSPRMREVPTIAEAGYPEFEMQPYSCIYAPAGTPTAIVDRLSAEVGRALRSPDTLKRLVDLGVVPAPTSPEEFAEIVRREAERMGKLIRERDIRAD